MSWKDKFNFTRTDDEILLNIGVHVRIGGCGKSDTEIVLIKEPSLGALSRMVERVVKQLKDMSSKDTAWVDKVVRQPSSVNAADLAHFKPLVTFAQSEIATLVGKEEKYVEDEMSAGQVTELIAAWLKVVGFNRIRDLFLQMGAEFQKVNPSLAQSTEQEDETLSSTN